MKLTIYEQILHLKAAQKINQSKETSSTGVNAQTEKIRKDETGTEESVTVEHFSRSEIIKILREMKILRDSARFCEIL